MKLLDPDREVVHPGDPTKKLGLRYALNAQILFEEKAGKHPREVDWKAPTGAEIRLLMWAELEGYRLKHRKADPPFTLEEAGDLFTDYGGVLGGVYGALLDGMVAGTRSVAGEGAPPGGAPAGTGTPPSPAPAPPTGAGSS